MPANIQAPELEFSSHFQAFPSKKERGLISGSVQSGKKTRLSAAVFQAVCTTLGFCFCLAWFTLWLDKHFVSPDLSRPLPHHPTCSHSHACFNEPSLHPCLHTIAFLVYSFFTFHQLNKLRNPMTALFKALVRAKGKIFLNIFKMNIWYI